MRSETVVPAVCDPGSDKSLDTLIGLARDRIKWLDRDADYFLDKVDRIREAGTWPKAIPFGEPTWDRFCEEVLGFGAAFIDRIREGKEILASRGVATPTAHQALTVAERAADPLPLGEPGRPAKDEGPGSKPIGKRRDTEYLTARIARDRPDILARMQAGEFKSVRAAAIAAGIVRPIARVSIPVDDPDAAALALVRHFQGERLEQLRAMLAALARCTRPR
jgi:hypothetical protein